MASTPDLPDGAYDLVVERDERLFDASAGAQKAAAQRDRRFLIRLAAASLLAHGLLLFAVLHLERAPDKIRRSQEIPVEVVIEPPPQAKNAEPQSPAPEKRAPPPPVEKSKPEQSQMRASAPEPKRAPDPKPPERSSPAAPEQRRPAAAPAQKEATRKPALAEKPAEKPAPSGPSADKSGGADPRPAAAAGRPLPFDLGPSIFRAVATPLPVEGGDEPMNYKVIVFGMLERAKHFPEAALARRASGVSVIGFSLDETGQVLQVALLRSSGDVDLDAESVAVVTRAAPFPAPPLGAPRFFAAEISFGAQE